MNRKTAINRISELFSRFVTEVESLNANGLYDINSHSENVIIPLLNKVYNLNLSNANVQEINTPGIDLIDKENRVTVQVTSDAKGDKVVHTLSQFKKYNKEKDFDLLLHYILTKRQKKYTSKEIPKLAKDLIEFDPVKHIIDFTFLLKEINSWISLDKINDVRQLLEQEFTEEKIAFRKNISENRTKEINEILYPNILTVDPPSTFFISELKIDRDSIIKKSWETTYKLKRSASNRKVVLKALELNGVMPIYNWHIYGNKLMSFFNPSTTILADFIEVGSVEELNLIDFCNIGLNETEEIKKLINVLCRQQLFLKGIKYLPKEYIYRFSCPKIAKERKVSWKLIKKATRKVVTEMWNEDKTQISSFKHLAFKTSLIYSDDQWYMTITPTWTFTWNGFQKSFNHAKLLTGIKNMENNQSVYNSFRFIAYCLINTIEDETDGEKLIAFGEPIRLQLKYEVE